MFELTQRRLTIRFALVLLVFTVVVLTVIFIYFRRSVTNAGKRHMQEEIQEFSDQFHRTGLDTLNTRWNEYNFQILNMKGDIVVASRGSHTFYPGLNRGLLAKAFSGENAFERVRHKNAPYLVAYFPLNENYSGRIASSFKAEFEYEENFRSILLVTFPGLLLLSFLVSRYLVKQAMKPISDAFTFQENFSSNVSHELRSPLASLKGNLEVSLRKERSPEDYREVIRFGLTEVDRIIHLLNDLYLLASSRFKPLDLFREQVDIGKMVEEILKAGLPRIETKKIRVVNTLRSPLYCLCDEALTRQVFENILGNAVNYTPEGGLISVDTQKMAGKMLVNISNTCMGLSNSDVKFLFEPFYRGVNTRQKHLEGKGLGLFIARYIVRSHGGEITAKITDEGLFSLTVSLPAR